MLRQQKHLIHRKQLSKATSNNRQYSSSVTYILTQSLLDAGAVHSRPVTCPITLSILLEVSSLSPLHAWSLLLRRVLGDDPKRRVTQRMLLPFGCFLSLCMCLSTSIYGTLFVICPLMSFTFFLLWPNLNGLLVLKNEKRIPGSKCRHILLYVE